MKKNKLVEVCDICKTRILPAYENSKCEYCRKSACFQHLRTTKVGKMCVECHRKVYNVLRPMKRTIEDYKNKSRITLHEKIDEYTEKKKQKVKEVLNGCKTTGVD